MRGAEVGTVILSPVVKSESSKRAVLRLGVRCALDGGYERFENTAGVRMRSNAFGFYMVLLGVVVRIFKKQYFKRGVFYKRAEYCFHTKRIRFLNAHSILNYTWSTLPERAITI